MFCLHNELKELSTFNIWLLKMGIEDSIYLSCSPPFWNAQLNENLYLKMPII